MSQSVQNKRKVARKTLSHPVKTSFYQKGMLHDAIMTDISTAGARFVHVRNSNRKCPRIGRGKSMEYYVAPDFGTTKCRGTVRWISKDQALIQWGIELTEIAEEKNDPLHKLIRLLTGPQEKRVLPVCHVPDSPPPLPNAR